jgi:hypothetical protein
MEVLVELLLVYSVAEEVEALLVAEKTEMVVLVATEVDL